MLSAIQQEQQKNTISEHVSRKSTTVKYTSSCEDIEVDTIEVIDRNLYFKNVNYCQN